MDNEPFISIKNIMSLKLKDQKWLVDRLIPKGAITIISGQAGSYKSYTALGIALAVAKGQRVMDKSAKKGKVLIVDFENSYVLIKQRLKQLTDEYDLDIEYVSRKFIYSWDFSDDELSQSNVDMCVLKNIDLVIIDSLIRAHSSEENTSTTMAKVMKNIKKFCDYGITVLILHHHRKGIAGQQKNYGESLRGSSDVLAATDSHTAISRNGDEITFHQTKMRFAPELPPFKMKINIPCNGVDEKLFTMLDEDIQATLQKKSQQSILDLLKEKGETALTDIQEDLKSIAGLKTIKMALDKLEKAKKIKSTTKAHNKKFYALV